MFSCEGRVGMKHPVAHVLVQEVFKHKALLEGARGCIDFEETRVTCVFCDLCKGYLTQLCDGLCLDKGPV